MSSMNGVRAQRPLFFLLAILSVATVLSGCSEEKVELAEVVRPVKVVEIRNPDEARQIVYSGSIQARTEVVLGFRVGGKLIERAVDIGQRVDPGDVLARMDPNDLDLAVRSAEATVVSAKALVDTATTAERRAAQLFERGISAEAVWEQRKLEKDQALANYEAALSARAQAVNQVGYAELKADVAGIVTAVAGVAGQVVSAGAPVVTIARDGEKEISIAVPEQEIRYFAIGKTVDARFWANDDLVLKAKVREVAGSADPASRTYAVRLSLPDDPRLLLGMTATVAASIDAAHEVAITVPVSALSQKDGRSVVWLVDRATATVASRPVTVSGFAENGVRIVDGLASGDVVVSAGTQFMLDGLKVKLTGGDGPEISRL